MRASFIALAVGLVLPFVITNQAVAQDSTNARKPSYLFAFEGQKAKLRPAGNNTNKLILRMPIRGSNHKVTWFTDRPTRDAGHIDMNEFLQFWASDEANGFKDNPTNVAITFGEETLIAEMIDPEVVIGAGGTKSLVSTLKLLNATKIYGLKEGSKGMTAHARRAGANSYSGASELKEISVFVDQACVINPNAWGCQCPGPWNSYCALQ
jgi:hypothetical protein